MMTPIVPHDPVKPRSLRVLLLEDDVQLAQNVQGLLEAEGFEVHRVPNGADGLRALLAEEFHVILCDMVMPYVSGDMFYWAVRRVRPEFCDRFIFTTGHREDKKVNSFFRSVSGLVVWKPFMLHDLLDAIRGLHGAVRPKGAETVAAA
jgi:DNA-binding response OmpR family regulator